MQFNSRSDVRRCRGRNLAVVLGLFGCMPSAHAALVISTAATQNVSCTAGVCSATARKAVLNVDDLASMLAGGDVTVASASKAKDIQIKAALSWVSTSRLTLDSYRSVLFDAPVTVAGTGALTITTDDGGTDGDFRFFGRGHAEFWDTGSDLTINGNHYRLEKSLKTLAIDVRHVRTGFYALARNFNAAKHTYAGPPVANLQGTFEGLGNVVSNLTIISSQSEQVGLFAELNSGGDSSGTIRDFRLKNVQITANSSGCVAALVATNTGTILYSYAEGQITSGNGELVGGLVCENTAGTIRQSYAAVNIVGPAEIVGGLVAEDMSGCLGVSCEGLIDRCYATGSINSVANGVLGGLVGDSNGGDISNSYATGNVTGGDNASVGGLIGRNEDNPGEQSDPLITASYSTGLVSGGSGASLGGLIGEDLASPGITDAYWNLDTSGVSDPAKGAGNSENDPGIAGLTTAELQSGLPAGFDTSIWREKPRINNGMPYLLSMPSR